MYWSVEVHDRVLLYIFQSKDRSVVCFSFMINFLILTVVSVLLRMSASRKDGKGGMRGATDVNEA